MSRSQFELDTGVRPIPSIDNPEIGSNISSISKNVINHNCPSRKMVNLYDIIRYYKEKPYEPMVKELYLPYSFYDERYMIYEFHRRLSMVLIRQEKDRYNYYKRKNDENLHILKQQELETSRNNRNRTSQRSSAVHPRHHPIPTDRVIFLSRTPTARNQSNKTCRMVKRIALEDCCPRYPLRFIPNGPTPIVVDTPHEVDEIQQAHYDTEMLYGINKGQYRMFGPEGPPVSTSENPIILNSNLNLNVNNNNHNTDTCDKGSIPLIVNSLLVTPSSSSSLSSSSYIYSPSLHQVFIDPDHYQYYLDDYYVTMSRSSRNGISLDGNTDMILPQAYYNTLSDDYFPMNTTNEDDINPSLSSNPPGVSSSLSSNLSFRYHYLPAEYFVDLRPDLNKPINHNLGQYLHGITDIYQCKLLLHARADVNHRLQHDGTTPLHNCKSIEIMMLLLENGANYLKYDKYNRNPMVYWAMSKLVYIHPLKKSIINDIIDDISNIYQDKSHKSNNSTRNLTRRRTLNRNRKPTRKQSKQFTLSKKQITIPQIQSYTPIPHPFKLDNNEYDLDNTKNPDLINYIENVKRVCNPHIYATTIENIRHNTNTCPYNTSNQSDISYYNALHHTTIDSYYIHHPCAQQLYTNYINTIYPYYSHRTQLPCIQNSITDIDMKAALGIGVYDKTQHYSQFNDDNTYINMYSDDVILNYTYNLKDIHYANQFAPEYITEMTNDMYNNKIKRLTCIDGSNTFIQLNKHDNRISTAIYERDNEHIYDLSSFMIITLINIIYNSPIVLKYPDSISTYNISSDPDRLSSSSLSSETATSSQHLATPTRYTDKERLTCYIKNHNNFLIQSLINTVIKVLPPLPITKWNYSTQRITDTSSNIVNDPFDVDFVRNPSYDIVYDLLDNPDDDRVDSARDDETNQINSSSPSQPYVHQSPFALSYNHNKNTILNYATSYPLVWVLIQCHVDLNLYNSPLYHHNDYKAVKLLLQFKVNPNGFSSRLPPVIHTDHDTNGTRQYIIDKLDAYKQLCDNIQHKLVPQYPSEGVCISNRLYKNKVDAIHKIKKKKRTEDAILQLVKSVPSCQFSVLESKKCPTLDRLQSLYSTNKIYEFYTSIQSTSLSPQLVSKFLSPSPLRSTDSSTLAQSTPEKSKKKPCTINTPPQLNTLLHSVDKEAKAKEVIVPLSSSSTIPHRSLKQQTNQPRSKHNNDTNLSKICDDDATTTGDDNCDDDNCDDDNCDDDNNDGMDAYELLSRNDDIVGASSLFKRAPATTVPTTTSASTATASAATTTTITMATSSSTAHSSIPSSQVSSHLQPVLGMLPHKLGDNHKDCDILLSKPQSCQPISGKSISSNTTRDCGDDDDTNDDDTEEKKAKAQPDDAQDDQHCIPEFLSLPYGFDDDEDDDKTDLPSRYERCTLKPIAPPSRQSVNCPEELIHHSTIQDPSELIPGPLTTPLHQCKLLRIAEVLIEYNADPNYRNSKGETPLHTIDNPDIIEYLCRKKADVTISTFDHGYQPLHVASNSFSCLFLLQSQACPNAVTFKNETRLYDAVRMRDLYLIQILIQYNADIGSYPSKKDVYSRDNIYHPLLVLQPPTDNIINGILCEFNGYMSQNNLPVHIVEKNKYKYIEYIQSLEGKYDSYDILQTLLYYGASTDIYDPTTGAHLIDIMENDISLSTAVMSYHYVNNKYGPDDNDDDDDDDNEGPDDGEDDMEYDCNDSDDYRLDDDDNNSNCLIAQLNTNNESYGTGRSNSDPDTSTSHFIPSKFSSSQIAAEMRSKMLFKQLYTRDSCDHKLHRDIFLWSFQKYYFSMELQLGNRYKHKRQYGYEYIFFDYLFVSSDSSDNNNYHDMSRINHNKHIHNIQSCIPKSYHYKISDSIYSQLPTINRNIKQYNAYNYPLSSLDIHKQRNKHDIKDIPLQNQKYILYLLHGIFKRQIPYHFSNEYKYNGRKRIPDEYWSDIGHIDLENDGEIFYYPRDVTLGRRIHPMPLQSKDLPLLLPIMKEEYSNLHQYTTVLIYLSKQYNKYSIDYIYNTIFYHSIRDCSYIINNQYHIYTLLDYILLSIHNYRTQYIIYPYLDCGYNPIRCTFIRSQYYTNNPLISGVYKYYCSLPILSLLCDYAADSHPPLMTEYIYRITGDKY